MVSGRNLAWKTADETVVLLDLDPSLGLNRFNDLVTDHAGRVYVGSVDFDPADPEREPRPGQLQVVDLDGGARILDRSVGTANGIGVSPDGRRLYFADTRGARGVVL